MGNDVSDRDHDQARWRARLIATKLDLLSFGVRSVEIARGVTMWSVPGRPELYLDPELALATLGFGVCVGVGGEVFVGTWL
jgi:hypothetical protein